MTKIELKGIPDGISAILGDDSITLELEVTPEIADRYQERRDEARYDDTVFLKLLLELLDHVPKEELRQATKVLGIYTKEIERMNLWARRERT